LDPDNAPSDVTFSITAIEGGEIQVEGLAVSRFTYADVIAGTVAFVPSLMASSNRFFSFTVDDLDEDGSAPNEYTFVINEAAGTFTFTEDDPVSAVNSETITIPVSLLLENDVTSPSQLLSVDSVNPTTTLGGSVYFDGVNFVYTAPKTAVGEDRIEYTIVDETGARGEAYLIVQLNPTPAEKALGLEGRSVGMIETAQPSSDVAAAKSALSPDPLSTDRWIYSPHENGPFLPQMIPGLFTLLLANQQLVAELSARFGSAVDPLSGLKPYFLTSAESNIHSLEKIVTPSDLVDSLEERVASLAHVPVLTEVVDTQVRVDQLEEILAAGTLPGQESLVSQETFDRVANESASIERFDIRAESLGQQISDADFERAEYLQVASEAIAAPMSAHEDFDLDWLIGSASELEDLITADRFQLQSDDFLIDFERIQDPRDVDPALMTQNDVYPDLGLRDVLDTESDTLEFLVDSEIRQVLDHQRPSVLVSEDEILLGDQIAGGFDDLWLANSVPEIEVILHQNSVDLFG